MESAQVQKYFLVDNTNLGVKTSGLAYRKSKNLHDKQQGRLTRDDLAQWGSLVRGIDCHDGWVQVGDRYLPVELNGIRVVVERCSEEVDDVFKEACNNSSNKANCDVLDASSAVVEDPCAAVNADGKQADIECLAENSCTAIDTRSQRNDFYGRVIHIANDPVVKIAGTAVGGATVGGAAAGVLGATTGAVVGGSVGIVGAPFTLGLSIPLGAVVGGGIGFSTCAVAGSSVGFAIGGAVSYRASKTALDSASKTDDACNESAGQRDLLLG